MEKVIEEIMEERYLQVDCAEDIDIVNTVEGQDIDPTKYFCPMGIADEATKIFTQVLSQHIIQTHENEGFTVATELDNDEQNGKEMILENDEQNGEDKGTSTPRLSEIVLEVERDKDRIM